MIAFPRFDTTCRQLPHAHHAHSSSDWLKKSEESVLLKIPVVPLIVKKISN